MVKTMVFPVIRLSRRKTDFSHPSHGLFPWNHPDEGPKCEITKYPLALWLFKSSPWKMAHL